MLKIKRCRMKPDVSNLICVITLVGLTKQTSQESQRYTNSRNLTPSITIKLLRTYFFNQGIATSGYHQPWVLPFSNVKASLLSSLVSPFLPQASLCYVKSNMTFAFLYTCTRQEVSLARTFFFFFLFHLRNFFLFTFSVVLVVVVVVVVFVAVILSSTVLFLLLLLLFLFFLFLSVATAVRNSNRGSIWRHSVGAGRHYCVRVDCSHPKSTSVSTSLRLSLFRLFGPPPLFLLRFLFLILLSTVSSVVHSCYPLSRTFRVFPFLSLSLIPVFVNVPWPVSTLSLSLLHVFRRLLSHLESSLFLSLSLSLISSFFFMRVTPSSFSLSLSHELQAYRYLTDLKLP